MKVRDNWWNAELVSLSSIGRVADYRALFELWKYEEKKKRVGEREVAYEEGMGRRGRKGKGRRLVGMGGGSQV